MEWIGQLALSVATGAAASWVAVQLALQRFYQEKWWEQRFAAYTAVIEALHRFSRTVHHERAERERNPDKAPTHDRLTDVEQPIQAIWRAMDMGELFISTDMIRLLREVIKAIKGIGNVEKEDRIIPEIAKILDEAIPKAVQIARRDLRLVPWRLTWKRV